MCKQDILFSNFLHFCLPALENSTDYSEITDPFKRFFEVYINQDGYTFTHERGRLSILGSDTTVNDVDFLSDSDLTGINLYKISNKLRGYSFDPIDKITLRIDSFDQATGIFSGYLCKYDGIAETNLGPVTTGKKGEPVRFYDETNVDFIDFIFDLNDTIPQISDTSYIDIQLFPTLSW